MFALTLALAHLGRATAPTQWELELDLEDAGAAGAVCVRRPLIGQPRADRAVCRTGKMEEVCVLGGASFRSAESSSGRAALARRGQRV